MNKIGWWVFLISLIAGLLTSCVIPEIVSALAVGLLATAVAGTLALKDWKLVLVGMVGSLLGVIAVFIAVRL
jgi:hypothetical protein